MRALNCKFVLSILVMLILAMVAIVPVMAETPQTDGLNIQDEQNTSLAEKTLVRRAPTRIGLYIYYATPIRSTTTIYSDNPDPSRAGRAVDVWFRVMTKTSPPRPIAFRKVTVSVGGNSCYGFTNFDGRGHCSPTLPQPGSYVIRAKCDSVCRWVVPPGGDFPYYYCYFVGSSDTEAHTVVP